jgi:hypothetical protein
MMETFLPTIGKTLKKKLSFVLSSWEKFALKIREILIGFVRFDPRWNNWIIELLLLSIRLGNFQTDPLIPRDLKQVVDGDRELKTPIYASALLSFARNLLSDLL